MTKKFCKIDKHICVSRTVNTRSKKRMNLFYCKKCDFEFFTHNPKKNLKRNKLDVSRLEKAGMKIPEFKEDFENGVLQSKIYVKKYIDKKDKKNGKDYWWIIIVRQSTFGRINVKTLVQEV